MIGTRAVRKFVAANRRLNDKVEPYLPQARTDIFDLYERVVGHRMNARADQIVVDVGGGRSSPFAKHVIPSQRPRIIAVDISEEELKHNTDAAEKRVANVAENLPFEADEVDLVVSRSVLEHLEKVDDFVADSSRILKQDGYFIHLFPSRFAPFALINQVLPQDLSRRVLHFLRPESKGICGFPAFYRDCYYTRISELLRRHDFEVVNVYLSYYQSQYFSFFVPLYVASALYELVIRSLKAKDLCAYLLVVARKKGNESRDSARSAHRLSRSPSIQVL